MCWGTDTLDIMCVLQCHLEAFLSYEKEKDTSLCSSLLSLSHTHLLTSQLQFDGKTSGSSLIFSISAGVLVTDSFFHPAAAHYHHGKCWMCAQDMLQSWESWASPLWLSLVVSHSAAPSCSCTSSEVKSFSGTRTPVLICPSDDLSG